MRVGEARSARGKRGWPLDTRTTRRTGEGDRIVNRQLPRHRAHGRQAIMTGRNSDRRCCRKAPQRGVLQYDRMTARCGPLIGVPPTRTSGTVKAKSPPKDPHRNRGKNGRARKSLRKLSAPEGINALENMQINAIRPGPLFGAPQPVHAPLSLIKGEACTDRDNHIHTTTHTLSEA
jgi:hypothetical protein